MTWAKAIAQGGGPIEYRLVFAGYRREWCTDGLTLGNVTTGVGEGRVRCAGLQRQGLRKSERARLAEGLPDQSGFTASIVDIDDQATAEFTSEPGLRTWLVESVDTTDTAFRFSSNTGMVDDGYYHIGTEVIRATSKPFEMVPIEGEDGFTIVYSADEYNVARGLWQTIAQGHWVQRGDTPLAPELTDLPVMMTGRRAFLYAHGPAQNALTSEGTLVFRGVVAGEPQERDGVWSIRIDPLVSVLDQDIVQPLTGRLTPIGVYYPWDAPLVIRLRELTDGVSTSSHRAASSEARVELSGYYATQEAFAEALNTELASATVAASFAGKVYAAVEGGRWELYYTTSSTAYWLRVHCYSGVDGVVEPGVLDAVFATGDTGPSVLRVAIDSTYRVRWLSPADPAARTRGQRGPVGVYGNVPADQLRGYPRINGYGDQPSERAVQTTSNPNLRLFVREAIYLSVGDVITLTHEGTRDLSLNYTIAAIDVTNGAIDLLGGGFGNAWVGEYGPKIAASNSVNIDGVSLSGFRDQMVTDGPLRGNLGDTPLLDANDIASWTAPVSAASNGRAVLSRRVYAFPRRQSLRQVLQHELRVYGLFAYTDAAQKLAVRQLLPSLATDRSVYTVQPWHREIEDGFGVVDVVADGVINVAEMRTGYEPEQDSFSGDTFIFPNGISISRLAGRKRTLEIHPRVALADGVTWTRDDARQTCIVPISYFGERYHVLSLPVTLEAFELLVGDAISVDVPQLPWRGARGLSTLGVVIGYDWDFATGLGTLEVLLKDTSQLAGYAPSLRVVSSSNLSGDTWEITVQGSRYAPSGVNDVEFFDGPYRVRVTMFDDDSGTAVYGTLQSVFGNVIVVEFDGTWTPSTDVWDIVFADHADARAQSAPDEMFVYAFIGDERKLLSDNLPARSFGP